MLLKSLIRFKRVVDLKGGLSPKDLFGFNNWFKLLRDIVLKRGTERNTISSPTL